MAEGVRLRHEEGGREVTDPPLVIVTLGTSAGHTERELRAAVEKVWLRKEP